MSLYLRHTASNYNLLYQPMNWLATHIPSLRDFYTCRRHLTRSNAALHATQSPYTPKGPYTAQCALIPSLRDFYTLRSTLTRCASRPTRRNSALTRPAGALHGAPAPLHAATPPYTAQRALIPSLRDFHPLLSLYSLNCAQAPLNRAEGASQLRRRRTLNRAQALLNPRRRRTLNYVIV